MVFMRAFRGEKKMGHVFGRCSFKINMKWKRFEKKKMQFSGLLFFLSIVEVGLSAVQVAAVGLGSMVNNLSLVYSILEFILVYD